MDEALSCEEQNTIRNILELYKQQGIEFHAFLTRQAGARQFVSFHVLVPGSWSVMEGHQVLEQIEEDIRKAFPRIIITTHLEPIEDPRSYCDIDLDRMENN